MGPARISLRSIRATLAENLIERSRHCLQHSVLVRMFRFAGVVFLCGAAIFSAPGRAQTPATPPADQIAPAAAQTQPGPVAKPAENTAPTDKPAAPSNPPTADDICRAVEQDAAQNELPVEF